MLIFDYSIPQRYANTQCPSAPPSFGLIPASLQRKKRPKWPECSELDTLRHYTKLSKLNFSIDTHFYPLGSCTMKYNPRGVHHAASLPLFLSQHPLAPDELQQGTLEAFYQLQNYLALLTGMAAVSLTPMAGSQGEFAGIAMIKAYHHSKGDLDRKEMLIPDTAHGTNPASAQMCGFSVIELPTLPDGTLCLETLRQKVGPKTAGIMLTNPSTLGLFMTQIKDIANIVHHAGGLLYYDGANLNAILGHIRPGDMGFDVIHLNLHKTFATPHGGGGPGSGPIAVTKMLEPFLPVPILQKNKDQYTLTQHHPKSIGRLSAFMGNAGILLRAYFYIRCLGQQGLRKIAPYATLNANYLQHGLNKIGYQSAFPNRKATHEFIITLQKEKKTYHISALDLAKRLLDFGIHAPTTYFPLMVPECLLIEPTETESKQTLDYFMTVMNILLKEMKTDPERLKQAPLTLPIKRLNDLKAAKELLLVHRSPEENPL